MTYDSHDSYVVLFGGCTATRTSCLAGGVSGETWKFIGGVWTRLTIAGPSARFGAAMADYEVGATNTHYVLLYGGCVSSPKVCSNLAGDTWKFAAGAWTQLHPTPAPAARYYASMSWDGSDGWIVLTAGCGSGGPMCPSGGLLGDTWAWTGSGWLPQGNAPFTARYAAAISDDPSHDEVILYGGCVTPGSGCPATPSAETWAFHKGVWTQLFSFSLPGPRMGAVMAPDASGGTVAIYGGCGTLNTCNVLAAPVTWLWSGSPTPSWATATPAPTYSPAPGYFAVMVWDAADGYDLYLDGCTATGSVCQPIGTDTWTYTTTVWNDISRFLSGPSARYGAALAYDPSVWTRRVHGAVILFGGCSAATCPMGDTWQFVGGIWTSLSPAHSPPARFDASMAFDARDGFLLLFGGCSAAPQWGGCPSASLLGDYWQGVAGTSGLSWSAFCGGGQGCGSPSARFAASMAYDSSEGQKTTILFGGYGCTNPPACSTFGAENDTWNFSAGAWTMIRTGTTPAARFGASMTFDASARIDTIVLFGGFDGRWLRSDLYEWNPGTPTSSWTALSPSGGPPLPRFQAMFAYDAREGRDLLFGGCTVASVPCRSGLATSTMGDSWTLTSASTWSQLSPAQSPPARSDSGIVYDEANSEVVLFGGSGILGLLTDTWLYASGSWGL